jgi:hypothetical protein
MWCTALWRPGLALWLVLLARIRSTILRDSLEFREQGTEGDDETGTFTLLTRRNLVPFSPSNF